MAKSGARSRVLTTAPRVAKPGPGRRRPQRSRRPCSVRGTPQGPLFHSSCGAGPVIASEAQGQCVAASMYKMYVSALVAYPLLVYELRDGDVGNMSRPSAFMNVLRAVGEAFDLLSDLGEDGL